LNKSATPLSADVTQAQAQGAYQFINHGKDITAQIKTAQNVRLDAGGAVSGAVAGTWTHGGSNKLTLTLPSAGGTFKGVLSRQWNASANAFVVTFTGQSADGVSVFGVRTAN